MSFSIRDVLKVDRKTMLSIDRVAKRYSKAPIDVLMPSGGYTPMDAYNFNLMAANMGANEVASQAKRLKVSYTLDIS